MWFRKNSANVFTLSRMIVALVLFLTNPNRYIFWVLYFYCILGDVCDGVVARRLKITSTIGALLDSLADVCFFVSLFWFFFLPLINIPVMFMLILLTAVIRILSYLIGYIKYHSFSSLHTWLNKTVGFLISILPLFSKTFKSEGVIFLVGGVVVCSALEELLITITAKKLDRNIKTIFTCSMKTTL